MKRHTLIPALFLFAALSIFGVHAGATEEAPSADARAAEEARADDVTAMSGMCKAECLAALRACLRSAQTDEDREQCSLELQDCFDACGD